MNPIPTKDQIRQWILDNPTLVAKRDIAKAQDIRIEIQTPVVRSESPDSAFVEFRQTYSAASFRDTSEKTLEWRKEGGQWLIVRESTRTVAKGR